eukprot:FR743473.1.p1 GENE.FR743473.1~~FR743473.1.p1  ORF type:complete len:189 (+),score=3.09 FR743473.1:329-895(+)
MALLRKGGHVHLKEYGRGKPINDVTFGLAWDVTNGVNIDLDASVIMFNASLEAVDIVSYSHLHSNDGAVLHAGDEQEGDEQGDDEKIRLLLSRLNPQIAFLGFCINSYSGQPLSCVSSAGCHIFTTATNTDLASFNVSGNPSLNSCTALLIVHFVPRPTTPPRILIHTCAKPAMGPVANDNVGELQPT